jgi:putative redox protein
MAEIFVESIYDSFAAEVTTGKHKLLVGEPQQYGGHEEGPDPYAYILSALGSCEVITLQMYAQRKNWPLEKIQVRLSHKKSHAIDCERCEEDDNAKLDYIESTIVVSGNLSAEQVERLGAIAKKCPVHKTLSAGINIETTLKHAVLTL